VTCFVVDCSITMAWHFEDEKNSYADKVLGILGISEALAPAVWTLEVSNVLLVGEKRGQTTSAKSRTFVALIRSLPIRVVDHSPAQVFDEVLGLARDRNLTTYDAAYLDLARRLEMPIASIDRRITGAAKRLGVPRLSF
jgi:predicted nucleic acid-binding protein